MEHLNHQSLDINSIEDIKTLILTYNERIRNIQLVYI